MFPKEKSTPAVPDRIIEKAGKLMTSLLSEIRIKGNIVDVQPARQEIVDPEITTASDYCFIVYVKTAPQNGCSRWIPSRYDSHLVYVRTAQAL